VFIKHHYYNKNGRFKVICNKTYAGENYYPIFKITLLINIIDMWRRNEPRIYWREEIPGF
jgi:hypothetical protein